MYKRLICVILVLMMSSCAFTRMRFKKVSPGMTQEQVSQLMKRGPVKVEDFKGDYSAWYYGMKEDYCVLFHKDKVTSLNRSRIENYVNTPVGKYVSIRKALCVKPGIKREPIFERRVRFKDDFDYETSVH